MIESEQFTLWLVAWLLGFVLAIWGQRKSSAGVGLVLAYALQLWVIHWLAPFIYALPWYLSPSPTLLAGVQESTYAIVGFAIGSALVSPLLALGFGEAQDELDVEIIDPRMLRSMFLLGVFAFIVQPWLKPIPTLGGLASVASNLLLAAFALACWNNIHATHRSIWRVIGLSALLPFVTIVTQGFLSYGFAAMLTVFAFVASVYRPRWRILAGGAVVAYLALSVYVTYMRDRGEIRAVVWADQPYSVRFTEMSKTFGDFEFLNLYSFDHLQRIDDRLNQSNLVGAAVGYLSSRPAEFARGETIWEALISPIPRALWPDKPTVAGSGELVGRFTGMQFNYETTSVGIGHVMEWYVNFGSVGVFFGSLCLGILIAIIDRFACRHLRLGDWSRFLMWYLPALGLLQVGGSLVEAIGSACAGFAIAAGIHVLYGYLSRHSAPADDTSLPAVALRARPRLAPPKS